VNAKKVGALALALLLGACSLNVRVVEEGRPCSPVEPCGPNTACIDNRCVTAQPLEHGVPDVAGLDGLDGLDAPGPDTTPDTFKPDTLKPDSKPICTAGAHPVTGKCLFRPSNITTQDYPLGAVGTLSLAAGTTAFDTVTGAITGPSGALRAAGTGIKSNIGFTSISQGAGKPVIGVFQLQSLSVPQGATLKGVGEAALMLWVAGDMSVGGLIDVKATSNQPGPAGGSGAIGGAGGPGVGKTPAIAGCDPGAGGGGFGATGGAGGPEDGGGAPCSVSMAGGSVYGNATLVPLYGGSAGGSGANGTTPKGGGGGGGGAVQIAAGASFTLTASGTIDAGGGGGPGMANGGGGGGSGGGILIEAPVVALDGVVAANGGGGGGGGDANNPGTSGSDALASTTAASGGAGKGVPPGNGGQGGVLSTAAAPGVLGDSGGGGGGGVGRIAIRTTSGSYGGTPTISPAPVKGVIPP